jgi:hypothetical protein
MEREREREREEREEKNESGPNRRGMPYMGTRLPDQRMLFNGASRCTSLLAVEPRAICGGVATGQRGGGDGVGEVNVVMAALGSWRLCPELSAVAGEGGVGGAD